MGRGRIGNLMDHVLKMMEKYAGSLEQTVSDRTKQLTDEMKKSDLLLYRMLPRSSQDGVCTYVHAYIRIAGADHYEDVPA